MQPIASTSNPVMKAQGGVVDESVDIVLLGATEDDTGTAKFTAYGSPTILSSSAASAPDPPPTSDGAATDGRTGCSIPFMFLLAAPRIAIMMAWSAQLSAIGPLLEILLGSSAVQLVQLVGPICGLVVVPSVGVVSDNCTSRHGRRRPFLFGGALASIAAYVVLLFSRDLGRALGDTDASRAYTAAITITMYVWTDVALNVAMVPANLILADFAGDRQVTASVVGGVVAAGGQLAVSMYITAFGPAHESLTPFLCMLIGTMGATTCLTCWGATERVHVRPSTERARGKSILVDAITSVVAGIRSLPPPLGVYFGILGLTQYGYASYNGAKGQFFGIVVKDGVSDEADVCGAACSPRQIAFNDGVKLAGLADMLQGLSLVYVLCLPALVQRVGARRVVVLGALPQTLLIVMALSTSALLDIAIAALSSITQVTIFLLAMPLVVHVVDSTELGMYSGALNSAMCLGQFLNYLIASVLVRTRMGYALPILVGGVMTALAFVVALTKFHVKMHSL
ncbi:Aste57867_15798 [Aphanomyces stellatus]|uniref:Aste57867_15798 protein n=1 Tax=Aphanomyces stellatus TaxID=120398 RepID=A0A485L3W5_9STRA|nr:hypothetical protein As57867_015742 [Aphanomyces stellatus]VFT92586.1 Aste57867_15798 [Aphanomyces stellatus]